MSFNKGVSLNPREERDNAGTFMHFVFYSIDLILFLKLLCCLSLRSYVTVFCLDELRTAVKEVICDSDRERRQYEEALIAITVDESLKK